MSSNRHSRNPQQLRALIENMGRSIDEARNRRLGPMPAPSPAFPTASNGARNGDLRYATQPLNPAPTTSMRAEPASSPTGSHHPHQNPPPVRSANEMFEGGTPRLKARPKRAS